MMSKPKLDSPASLKDHLAAVSNDVVWASAYFQLSQDLLREARRGYAEYMNHAANFWTMTVQSLLDVAILRLCRVYDQRRDVISLPSLLRAIQEKESLVAGWTNEYDVSQLRLDIKAVSVGDTRSSDSSVEQLVAHRKNIVAHRSVKAFEEPSLGSLRLDVVSDLLERARVILNRWTIAFGREEYGVVVSGNDDFMDVLCAVRLNVDARRREVGAEPYIIQDVP